MQIEASLRILNANQLVGLAHESSMSSVDTVWVCLKTWYRVWYRKNFMISRLVIPIPIKVAILRHPPTLRQMHMCLIVFKVMVFESTRSGITSFAYISQHLHSTNWHHEPTSKHPDATEEVIVAQISRFTETISTPPSKSSKFHECTKNLTSCLVGIFGNQVGCLPCEMKK